MKCQIRLRFGSTGLCNMLATHLAHNDVVTFYVCKIHKTLLPKMQPEIKYKFSLIKQEAKLREPAQGKVINIKCIISKHNACG